MLALVFFFSSMYLLFKKAKKEDQIKNAIRQKKLAELKAHEEYKAQFKSIYQIRKKFKGLKLNQPRLSRHA
jgi:predicted phage-related endonuclease